MKHIGTKLFVGFICMALLTITILWIVQAGFMRNTYLNKRINSVGHMISKTTASSTADYESLGEQLNASLIALDARGKLSYRSQGLPMMGMMVRTVQSMIPDEADGTPRYVNAMAGSARYALLGHQVRDGSYLFAVFSLADLDEAALIMRQQLWIITLVLVVSSVLLAVFLSGKLSRPIQAVTHAARDLAAGDYDVRLPVKNQDEIGQLTIALNDLGIELGRTEALRRELIANVSHELRSPLAVIQGYAETVRDVTWPDETKRSEQLNIIVDESSRLSQIVKDILDYSRLQAGVEQLKLSVFEICPVFELLLKKYELEASRRQLALSMSCPNLTVNFDKEQLDQILNNLMNNAINHARPGTVIEVSVIAQNQHSRIEVKNQGQPIPADMLTRIWDRYYRSSQINGEQSLGTGLGLAIVKSIFERHGVRYGVISEHDQTIFWFETCNLAIM
ncbi:MAG: HAMP domain-containing histidine kinase [Clostridiaceae bacterium]|nr:HAMP domain-containing histidine kinase [Clostridiaceae bacterium]